MKLRSSENKRWVRERIEFTLYPSIQNREFDFPEAGKNPSRQMVLSLAAIKRWQTLVGKT